MSMLPRLSCPLAQYTAGMQIKCTRSDDLCAHQRYCMSKGWYVLTDQAGACPARKDENHERKTVKATAKRRNKV